MSSAEIVFENRESAGRHLANALGKIRLHDPLILAVPNGGVPVAIEVARQLHAPLDLFIVRMIAAPGDPDVAIGAVADGGEPHIVLDDEKIGQYTIPPGYLDGECRKQLEDVDRCRKMYRGTAPVPSLKGRSVILVDDCIERSVVLRVAIDALRRAGVASIAVAAPVASRRALVVLGSTVDDIVCLHRSDANENLAAHYADFPDIDDVEITAMLSGHDDHLTTADSTPGRQENRNHTPPVM